MAFDYQFARTVTGAPVEEKKLSVKAQKLLEQQRRDKAKKKKKAREIEATEEAKII